MSNLCKTQLCSTVQNVVTGIENACVTTDILFSSFSVDRIEPTNRISKANFRDLPDANTVPNGHIAYLDDAKVPVIASNCSWIGLDGRTVGTFNENQIWSWGNNACGRLGDGTTLTRCSPVRERCSATDWRQVSGGLRHTAAVNTTGQIWTWGGVVDGALGDGLATANRCSPVREISSSTDWCQVCAGNVHTAAVKTSGEIWTWGRNNVGELGDGTATSRCSPVREISSSIDWCQVSAGGSFTAAVKTSGQLWAWGNNACGRLGDGTIFVRCSPVREICSATDWCSVSSGYRHTTAIKTSGQLWAWGCNAVGALGDGTTVLKCSPVREICSATDWCQVSSGYQHTAAVKTTGQIWVWGSNVCGLLGDGTTINRCSPVREFCSATDWCQSSACNHTAAVKTTGQIWVWGYNACGRLGDGTAVSRCSPVREFCSATEWCQVSAGACHTAALRSVVFVCR